MLFERAQDVESICYQIRQADWVRGKNRARINDLFNGVPPYSDEEVTENGIVVNVNDLASTRLAHDARGQFYNAFVKPGHYFNASTDMGPVHKRTQHGTTVSHEVNKLMKRSLGYFECFRSKFASNVLHGVGPAGWDDRDHWCPDPYGIEDIGIPANTLLTMKNVPFFYKLRSYTAPELIKMTQGPKLDPGWNMDLVKSVLEWIDQETTSLIGQNWPEIWSPEKASERVKSDGGFYAGDQVPTIDCFDFYFWSDEGEDSGWRRRMILDSWGTPGEDGRLTRKTGSPHDSAKGEFLFNPGKRKYGDKMTEIVSFQFADLSAVSPFRYHSVRSLGFLLYAVCHLQNRLRCKFNESVFEALMMLFRVKSMDDVQRAVKVDLYNRGFIDDSLSPVPAAERWQVNAGLVELGLKENAQLIHENSAAYSTNPNFSRDRTEKTKFQVMAEVNAMTSMVSSALAQAYQYQVFEYREIFRRFCKKHSSDPDVRTFRANCLTRGVPAKLLTPEAWEIEPERVMGAGNKTLEMTIAQQLMEWRPLFDPEPQRAILRDSVMAITDDSARAEALVPDEPVKVTDSVHDAQLAAAALMMGLPVAIKTGINHIEYIETLLQDMALIIKKAGPQGMLPPEQIQGLQNMAQHVSQHMQILAQDKNEKQRVKQYGDALGKLMNLVKAMMQRMEAAMKKQQQAQAGNGNGGLDPKDAAKIHAMMLSAQTKAQNARESHAQKTAQRKVQFEQQLKMDAQKQQAEIAAKDLETASEIGRNRLRSLGEGN